MDINQLRYFVAIVETGSFIKAAERSYISQPALSQQIQKLEIEFKEPLLNRNHRKIVPTAAGRKLFERAVRILQEYDEAQREIRTSAGIPYGKISIGALPTIAPYFLPHVCAQFIPQNPNTDLAMHEDMTARLLEMIDAGELDCCIVSLPIKENGFEKEELFTEELLLALPSNHPLATKPVIQIEDLCSETFILMQECHCLGDRSLAFWHKPNFRPHIVLRSSQIETILSLVMTGLGISLIPQMAKATGRLPLIYRSLENPRPTRTIAAVWRSKRESNGMLSELLVHVRQVSKTYIQATEK
jgi:LysR family hydrogen peroxide-inducible transcriptional activator